MNASEYFQSKLTEQIERLAELNRLDAPSVIISNEIIRLFQSAQLAFGSGFWEEMQKLQSDLLLSHYGFCTKCQEQNDATNDNLCSKCQRMMDRAIGEDHELN